MTASHRTPDSVREVQYHVCQLCKVRHKYLNPRQFTSWAGRHRKLKHPDHRGTIEYKREGTA